MTDIWWAEMPRDVLRISGADARRYLQGQISQDVDALGTGASGWSLVLSPQGKIEAWFRLHARGDDFVADVDAGYGDALVERLERFRLRVDVEFDRLDWSFGMVRGAAAIAPPTPTEGVVAEVTWPGFEGFDVLGPEVVAPSGAVEVDAEQVDYARIAAGWPRMGSELTEKTIPAEAGIVEQSVSFTKGCYTGQELVSRIDSRGNNTPRRLSRLVADGPLDAGGEIRAGDRSVGVVTSAASGGDRPTVALAYVHRSVDDDASLEVDGLPVSVVGR